MPRLDISLILGSLAFALAAGCGGGSGGGDVTVEDFCAEDTGAFSQFVGKLVECTPEFEFFLGGGPSEESIAGACNAQFAPFIDDGTTEFGEKADLDACIAAIIAANCQILEVDNLPECDNIVIGTIAEGEACEESDQCAGESYCAAAASGQSCGTCRATLPDGVDCSDDSDCINNNCRDDGTCGGYGLTGDTCETDKDCSGQLACNAGTCGVAVTKVVGDACIDFGDCGFPFSDLFCNESMMTCEAFIALGAECNNGSIALGLCNLLQYESCDTAGTRKCVAPTIVGAGDQCGFTTGRKCEAGLLCEGGAGGRCATPGEGSACIFDGEADTCGFFLECKSDDTCGYEDDYTGMCPAPAP